MCSFTVLGAFCVVDFIDGEGQGEEPRGVSCRGVPDDRGDLLARA
jgi:hypothetical protein